VATLKTKEKRDVMSQIAKQFPGNVAEHEMTVLRDDGVHRHVRFAKPGTGSFSFNLITWPWYLAYSGDMGHYMFCRLDDMFEFFRGHKLEGDRYPINPGYWAEKVVAEDHATGLEVFSPDKFREAVREYLRDAEASRDVTRAVREDVLSSADEGRDYAMRSVYEFHRDGFSFDDFSEQSCLDWSYRFAWCCHAIAWGVAKYDAAKAAAASA